MLTSTEDTSVVLYGSLARREFTADSDADWSLLVDGIADPQHLDSSLEIAKRIAEIPIKQPGREGTFGQLTFSHDLIHYIGGEDDTNANTTRRMLLLLESVPVGGADAYDRVLRNVLEHRSNGFARRFFRIVRHVRRVAGIQALHQRSDRLMRGKIRNLRFRRRGFRPVFNDRLAHGKALPIGKIKFLAVESSLGYAVHVQRNLSQHVFR